MAPFSDTHAHIQRIVRELVPTWLGAGTALAPPFLFLHALDAHGPYLPDAPFRDAFSRNLPSERHMTPAGSLNQTYRAIPEWMGRTQEPDEKNPLPSQLPLEDIVARYDESLLKVDAFLGELFDELKERGLFDEAVIVVTADHGETFGPDVFGHGVLREDVQHVPLILKLPHGAHGGLHVATPVQLVDLYPTLLELAGGDPVRAPLHGESLLRRLDEKADPERVRFTESGWVKQCSITVGRWKLVEEHPGEDSAEQSLLTHPRVPREWLRANFPELVERPLSKELFTELKWETPAALEARPEFTARIAELRKLVAGPYYALYDLERDPLERADLAPRETAMLERMQARLEQEKERSRRARADADPDFHRALLSPDALKTLNGLGYGK